MSAMTSQITSLTIVYSTIYSRRRSKKISKLRVIGFCEGNSAVTGEFPRKGPATRKMFPFDDVIKKQATTGVFVKAIPHVKHVLAKYVWGGIAPLVYSPVWRILDFSLQLFNNLWHFSAEEWFKMWKYIYDSWKNQHVRKWHSRVKHNKHV